MLNAARINWPVRLRSGHALFFQIGINRGDRREDAYYILLSLRYLYKYSLLCEPGVPGGEKTALFLVFCDFCAFFSVLSPREIRFTKHEIPHTRYSRPGVCGSSILIFAL